MKRFLSITLSLFLILSCYHFPIIKAQQSYYVSSSGSDSNNGSFDSPFQSINQAYYIANNQDTIIVLDEAIIHDTNSDDAPFLIDKQLTIKGYDKNASIVVRAGGILLGEDVTFENVSIGIAGFLRPGIAANGHHLTLNNVSQNTTLRPLQIYGGTFADIDGGIYHENQSGTHSIIEINDGSYDNLYAGSINTTNTLPVQINVSKTNSLSLNAIYVASVSKDPSDLNMAGQIPMIDSTILTNKVDIQLHDSSVRTIAGIHEENQITLTIQSENLYTPTLDYIDQLIIESSVISPKGSLTQTNVQLNGNETKKAVLDVSQLSHQQIQNLSSNDFGMLILAKEEPLSIQNVTSDASIEVRMSGGMPYTDQENIGYSGYIEYDTTLIEITQSSNGSFVILNPYPTQSDLALIQEDLTWKAYDGSFGLPPHIIDFQTFEQTFDLETANQDYGGYGGIDLNLLVTYHPDEYLTDLSYMPIAYQITYTNDDETIVYSKQNASMTDDGYYVCNYQDAQQTLMKLEAFGDTINICKGDKELSLGTYLIEISMQTTKGIQSKTVTLNIVEDVALPSIQSFQVSTTKQEYTHGENLDLQFLFYPQDNSIEGSIYLYNGSNCIQTIDVNDSVINTQIKINQLNGFQEGDYDLYFVYQSKQQSLTLFSDLQISVNAPLIEKVNHLQVQQINYKTIQLRWDVVEHATSYDIYRKGANAFEFIATTTTNEIEISKLKTGKEYQFYIIAKNEDIQSEPSEIITYSTRLIGDIQLNIEKISSNRFQLNWNQIEGATRYIIYRKYNDNTYQKVITLGKDVLTYTTSSLVTGNYHFIIKAGRYDGKERVLSEASNEVTTLANYPSINVSATLQENQCILTWDKIEGIYQYQIYRARSSNGKYYHLKTTKNTTIKTTYNQNYYYKVRGVQKYQGLYVYTSFSENIQP